MQKGDFLLTKDGKRIYQIVGRWDRDIVLAPTDEDDQVLIYGQAELEGAISEGHFRKLHKTDIKVNESGGYEE